MNRPPPGPDTVLRGHGSDVQAAAFHPQLDLLYSGDAGGEVRIWEIASRRTIARHRFHSTAAGVIGLACLVREDSSGFLVSQGREGSVRIWELSQDGTLSNSQPVCDIFTDAFTFCRMSVLDTSKCQQFDRVGLVACPGGAVGSIEVWSIQAGERTLALTPPPHVKYGMCMSMQWFQAAASDQPLLAVGYEDGTLVVWQLSEPQLPTLAAQLQKEPLMALAIDSQASGGICGSANKQIVGFTLNVDTRTATVRKCMDIAKEGISDIALRSDDKIYATAGWDGRIRVYNYRKGSCLAILKYHTAGATAVTFSRQHVLASAARDGTIALWSLYRNVG